LSTDETETSFTPQWQSVTARGMGCALMARREWEAWESVRRESEQVGEGVFEKKNGG
jgi:hypothetical protein